jgi:hypothetical protein
MLHDNTFLQLYLHPTFRIATEDFTKTPIRFTACLEWIVQSDD